MNGFMPVALGLFFITYVLMLSLQKARPWIALGSAALFVLLGSTGLFPDFRYSPMDALRNIDWNVILMISGTMGTVYLFIESKMPQRLSDLIISRLHTEKAFVVVMSLFAGVISAFLDNVATVLMIAPVALAVCKKLKISPVPAIICIAISSNLQGAATLVGDTTSILLAKEAGMDFLDFFFMQGKPGMFWVTEVGALAATLLIVWMFRSKNERFDVKEHTDVEDLFPTFLLAGTILALILTSFIPYEDAAQPGQFCKPAISNGLICMGFFLIGVIRQLIRDRGFTVIRAALAEIDYYTIGLLAGLFIVIGAVEKAGIIDRIGELLAGLGGGSRNSLFLIYTVIVWMSVLASAFIDNIPYTATMLPVVAVISNRMGAAVNPNLLYFGLLIGATLGGNLTPIGASANVAGIGILRKNGCEVSNGTFMKYAVPFTLAAVTTDYLLIWFIWS